MINGLRILPMPIYCGPRGVPQQTKPNPSFESFGFITKPTTDIEKGRAQQKNKQKVVEVLSSHLTKHQLSQKIELDGLNILKNQIHLEKLPKDLIRSIAMKMTSTPNSIPRYSMMTKDDLIDQLVQRGFKR